MAPPTDSTGSFRFDRIGYWSEIKLDIVRQYATAYSTILSAQPSLYHVYIDGFAGAGEHVSREKSAIVLGSPSLALEVQPPFREFFFIDLDGDKVDNLKQLYGARAEVHIDRGDCNRILLESVFPKVRYEDYRRGLCLLDPYGLDLEWQVIQTAGRLRTIDLFLNFPIMDANRNVLWHDPAAVHPLRRLDSLLSGEMSPGARRSIAQAPSVVSSETRWRRSTTLMWLRRFAAVCVELQASRTCPNRWR